MNLLIDTHVIIWLATGDEESLSRRAKRAFHESDELFLSVVSFWEIAIKRALRKLRWDHREITLFESGLRENQIQDLPVRRSHCEAVAGLPLLHRDPFDRMLIAQAQVEDLAILSADARFKHYDVKVVW